jgi:hypothetical protein
LNDIEFVMPRSKGSPCLGFLPMQYEVAGFAERALKSAMLFEPQRVRH